MGNSAMQGSKARHTLIEPTYRELFKKIQEGFFLGEIVRGEDGRRAKDFIFLEVNEAFVQQTGVSAEAALGRPVTEVIPGFEDELIQRYGEVVDTGRQTSFEVEVPALKHRWYEARAHPTGGERFAVLFLEITERKRIEKALEESRAMLSDIVETVDQIVWSARPDGYHDFFNGRWYEYTGAVPGTTEGAAWAELFHPEDRERTFDRWARSLETGEPYEIEYRLRHRSGEYRWVLGRAHPVRGAAGRIIRWMGTCTDIHQQKSIAEQLELASNELSHRIKNIFTVISSLVALSARQYPEAAAFTQDVRERIAALGRAHDYARPHGKDSAPGKEASVLGLVRQLLTPYALEGRERMVIEGEDAPLKEEAATPISLAVHELATNAAKYGAFSVPDGQVRIRGERSEERFTLHWVERGGPPAREPARFGFGSRLVDVTLKGQLRAELVRNWHPDGLEVCLSAPLDQLVAKS